MITFKSLGRYGRFGNQAFQIASVIGIAVKNNHPYCFPKWINHDHIERFGSTEDCDIYKHLINDLPEYRDVNYTDVHVPWGYTNYTFPPDKAFNLIGHMQSETYFAHCMDLIRYTFRMHGEPNCIDYTAIHWRAGDYTEGLHTYHPRQPVEYYHKAMQHIEGPYLVFSDDITDARQMFGSNVDYVEGNDYLTDFKLMKKCKHFICANSSFSLFAAILGEQEGKKIALPKLWFGEAAGGLSTHDIYPENSIVI